MFGAVELPMAKPRKGGRPRSEDADGGTRHVRVNPDIAEMISWILRVLGPEVSSAKLLDPILRGPIAARYKLHEKAINLLKEAEAEVQKQGKKPKE
jgi:hypothetical protein